MFHQFPNLVRNVPPSGGGVWHRIGTSFTTETSMIPRRPLVGALIRLRRGGSQIGDRPIRPFHFPSPRINGRYSQRRRNSFGRSFSTDTTTTSEAEKVSITFVEVDGTEREVQGVVGKHLLDIAHDNNIDLEGACGGELACSTCHLIFEKHIYDQLDPKEDDEEDMLDMALALTDT